MQFKQKSRLSKGNRSQITKGGYWYFVFSLLIGAAALYSNNNIIYLVESVMLGGLLFSGMISEGFLRSLTLTRSLHQAIAMQPCEDCFTLTNNGLLPVFLIEVGEWQRFTFISHGFALCLWPGKSIQIQSQYIYPKRGTIPFQSIGVSTSFPFGLVRRFRNSGISGTRIVWPGANLDSKSSQKHLYSPRGTLECIDGELDELTHEDDVSKAHWPSCVRLGRLVRRKQSLVKETTILEFDTRTPMADYEEKIMGNAKIIRTNPNPVTLYIINHDGSKKYATISSSMNALSLLPKANA